RVRPGTAVLRSAHGRAGAARAGRVAGGTGRVGAGDGHVMPWPWRACHAQATGRVLHCPEEGKPQDEDKKRPLDAILTIAIKRLSGWRRGWDSNPRYACTYA